MLQEYASITGGQVFNRPINPGLVPIIPGGATKYVILAVQNAYATNLKEFKSCNLVNQTLKNMIISAINDVHINSLEDEYSEYNNITILQLFNYLQTCYGAITNKDLSCNEKALKEKQNPSEPIETIFKRIEKAVVFAAKAGNVINNRRKIACIYNLIKVTNEFDTTCRDWRNQPTVEQTQSNFKLDFTRDYLACAEDQETSAIG